MPEGAERPLPSLKRPGRQPAGPASGSPPACLAAEGPARAAISASRSWRIGRDQRIRRVREAGHFGFFKGGFIKGRFAQLSHAVLYRRQLSLHGPYRAALLWLAERINALVQPKIRIS